MPDSPNASKLSSVDARVVLALAIAFTSITALAQFLIHVPAWKFDSPVEFNSDFAALVGAAWALYQLGVHRHEPRERRRWLFASGAMFLIVAVEVTDWLVDVGALTDDWLVDIPLWLTATVMLRLTLRGRPLEVWQVRSWRLGVAFQLVFLILDLGKARYLAGSWFSPQDVRSLTEWAELLAIECFVMTLVPFATIALPVTAGLRRRVLALGAEARHVYETGNFFRYAKYPPVRLAFYPFLRELLVFLTVLWLVAVIGPVARRASGRTLVNQLSDLLVLGFRYRFDPLSYYFQELYHSGGRAEAAFYLTRHETKNGLLFSLNSMRPQLDSNDGMKDKLLFAVRCQRHGLPSPEILLTSDSAGVTWRVGRGELDRDLFCKPRAGRGARGVLIFRRIGPERYRTSTGEQLDLDGVVECLRQRGATTPLIVQPRLRNHIEVADLAEASLVTIRVLTCLDAENRPVPTHGLLRVLSRLEPRWKGNEEYGAPICLVEGTLGAMVSDRLMACAIRHSHHPVTGTLVRGRVLTTWPAVIALAVSAHEAFLHRVFVGWDIALTDRGPVLLEGNTNLDVMFPQRACRQGFGRSSLAPLLRIHLAALTQEGGRGDAGQ